MPLIPENAETVTLPASNFGYSRTKIASLGAESYTLVTICLDCSGSTEDFAADLEKTVKAIVKSCSHSPRADNLLLRLVVFGARAEEFHGFLLLQNLDEAKYDNLFQEAHRLNIGYSTALFDTTEGGTAAMVDYGATLIKQDYSCNGILVVITDGLDNGSSFGFKEVKARFDEAKQQEKLESLLSILVAVNMQDAGAADALNNFSQKAGFTQFVDVGDATEKKVARLANFVSKSISSQSNALGSGSASKPINLTI